MTAGSGAARGPQLGRGEPLARLRNDDAMDPRTILHVDLDAFFAAVEQRDRPELRGKPVIVGGGGPNQRGVVSAASYEARGVRRPLGDAAPDGRPALPARRLPAGRRARSTRPSAARSWRSSAAITPLVEPISIDEAFLDVTGSRALFGDGETIGRRIRDDVRAEVGLTAVGRRRHGRSSSPRSPRTSASRTAWSSCRPGDGGRVPRAARDHSTVGRRREVRRGAPRVRRPDDRRPGGAAGGPPRPPLRQARRIARRSGHAGSTPIRSAVATRRSRSVTSTRSTSTRPIGR